MAHPVMRHPVRYLRATLPVFLVLLAADAGRARAVQEGDETEPAPKASSETAVLRVPAASTTGSRWASGSRPEGNGSSTSWWVAPAGVAALLAASVILFVGSRKQWGQASSTGLRVIGRTSLSPRHSIVLVQAGRRTLMIGLGPQAAPSLLGELHADSASVAPADGTGRRPTPGGFLDDDPGGERIPTHRPTVDVRLGGEE